MTTPPHIAIALASYNGAAHLNDQLASIAAQDHADWSLWVSDDGSDDATRDIVARFRAAQPHRRVTLIEGPRAGSTRNFMTLIDRITEGLGAVPDCLAFCDQDDVWLPGKLSRALAYLPDGPAPALYGARTKLVNEDLSPRGLSPLFSRPPGFANALVQSLAGGNTMLMNAGAVELIRRAGTGLFVVTHDWWAYQLVSGAGGRVVYDPEPTLLYRQHAGNLIGSNMGWGARVKRARAGWGGQFTEWNTMNLTALEQAADLLTPEARALVRDFTHLRSLRGPDASRALRNAGLYRQTRGGDLSLRAAALMGKI